MDQEIFLPLSKVDEEKRIIWARAAAEESDRTKEIMDYSTAVEAFKTWSAESHKASMGKSLGNVRVMHRPEVAGRVIDIAYKPDEKAIDVAIKIDDEKLWEMCKAGSYTGLSIGGGYAQKWADPQNPALTRYTPRLSEISVVDRPCMPSATFQIMKADGTVEVHAFPTEVQTKPAKRRVASFRSELAKIERREHSLFFAALNGWGRPMRKADDDDGKDGRAGRDADSDGKFHEKDGGGGDTRGGGAGDDATTGKTVGGDKQSAGGKGVKAEATIDTTTRAGYEARRKADEGYRAQTTQVVPEQRGALYGGLAGAAAFGIPAALTAGLQPFADARVAFSSRVSPWFQAMAGSAGAAAGRAVGSVAPGRLKSPSIAAGDKIGRYLGRGGMKVANKLYYGMKAMIGNAALAAAGGNRWVASAGLAAGFGAAAASQGYRIGEYVGSAHDTIFPNRRVEKGDGMVSFYEALADRPMGFGAALADRPMSFNEVMQAELAKAYNEADHPRDAQGRWTFKDGALLAGGAAAGGVAGYLLGRNAKKIGVAIENVTPSRMRSIVTAAKDYGAKAISNIEREASKYITSSAREFAKAPIWGKLVMAGKGVRNLAYVGASIALADQIIRRGTADIGFVEGGIQGSVGIKREGGITTLASFNTATGDVKLPGLFPGEKSTAEEARVAAQQQAQQQAQQSARQGNSAIPSGYSPQQMSENFNSLMTSAQAMDSDYHPKGDGADRNAALRLQGRELERVFNDRRAGKLSGGQATGIAKTIAFGKDRTTWPSTPEDWQRRVRDRIPPHENVYQHKDTYNAAINLARLADVDNDTKSSLANAVNSRKPPNWDEDGWAADARGLRYPAVLKNSEGHVQNWAPISVISKGDERATPAPASSRERQVERTVESTVSRSSTPPLFAQMGKTQEQWDAMTTDERGAAIRAHNANKFDFGLLAKAAPLRMAARFV